VREEPIQRAGDENCDTGQHMCSEVSHTLSLLTRDNPPGSTTKDGEVNPVLNTNTRVLREHIALTRLVLALDGQHPEVRSDCGAQRR